MFTILLMCVSQVFSAASIVWGEGTLWAYLPDGEGWIPQTSLSGSAIWEQVQVLWRGSKAWGQVGDSAAQLYSTASTTYPHHIIEPHSVFELVEIVSVSGVHWARMAGKPAWLPHVSPDSWFSISRIWRPLDVSCSKPRQFRALHIGFAWRKPHPASSRVTWGVTPNEVFVSNLVIAVRGMRWVQVKLQLEEPDGPGMLVVWLPERNPDGSQVWQDIGDAGRESSMGSTAVSHAVKTGEDSQNLQDDRQQTQVRENGEIAGGACGMGSINHSEECSKQQHGSTGFIEGDTEQQDILSACLQNEEAVLKAADSYREDGWVQKKDQKGLLVFTRTADGVHGCMGRCKIMSTAENILDAIFDVTTYKDSKCELLKEISWQGIEQSTAERSTCVVEWVDPGIRVPLITKRDFYVATHSAMVPLPDGRTFVASSVSIPGPHHDKCLPQKGYVRGQVVCPSGWVIKVLSEDPPVCGCTWMSLSRPGGKIPNKVVQMGAAWGAKIVLRVKAIAEKRQAQSTYNSVSWKSIGTPLSKYAKMGNSMNATT